MDLMKLVNERIESNKHLFTDYELNIIKENQLLIEKNIFNGYGRYY